ncbi:MAG TPA: hypothetical protein DEB06_02190 [Phycisphaerales bacterium]|nr:hypothetical protein [Phycisphaerales bacterium]
MRARPPTVLVTMWVLISSAHARGGGVEAITLPSTDLRLTLAVAGVVARVEAAPGGRVSAGDALVVLDDREAVALESLQRLRAQSTLEVDAAEAEWRLAQNEEARVRDAFEKDAAGAFEVERAALQTARRRVELDLTARRLEEAGLLLRQATLRREQFTLRAPVAGMVETVLVDPGEGVQPQQAVVRLVVTDPLRIEAAVPTQESLGLRAGQAALARLLLPATTGGGGEVLEARVVSVGAVADAASDTRLVRLEAPNPRGLPAGTRVVVEFAGPAPPAPAADR